ncbi:hypothetical protein GGX14DRAFT_401737 [Mycena pura]|uniref:Ribonuclease H1 N-terminal domain-containing protein n=1 Tax=Mycena pura TaxID=153505 RepID=A0AAD6V0A6_9AGAR|nr:hypothetical protein GGX14DRAFT_575608 [Mycena pura]KAJ7198754.1 hypothetical protein GGX14DRAFT_401737 [Mycena pura]
MPCVPPYYPCPGHESTAEHDKCSQCQYYAVWTGFVRGYFSNSWIARAQTERFTDSRQKSFKTKAEADVWWLAMCQANHQTGCPPFEAVDFTLDPDPRTHPSSAPCTRQPVAAPVVTLQPTSTPRAGASTSIPVAPSPFGPSSASPSSSSVSSTSSLSSSSSSGTRTTESPSPTPKKESSTPSLHLRPPPRITPLTRIQLTPTGAAHGATLAANRAEAAAERANAAADRVSGALVSTPENATPRRSGMASVLVTPSAATKAAPAPAPAPERVRMYGIRGVSVFYPSFGAARTAAGRLGLSDSGIMVSDNAAKLEAWMTGEPFIGEDA